MKIGVSSCSRIQSYRDWLSKASKNVATFELRGETDLGDVKDMDGIVFTGGEDIAPERYGRSSENLKLNPARDAFEFKLVEHCLKFNKPILGICRGMQLINVFMGGTLMLDLPSEGIEGHGKKDGHDQMHAIKVHKDSILNQPRTAETGEVNSAHHQGVLALGKNLRATAFCNNVIEAVEWDDTTAKPWMLLVQWHPERLSSVLFSNNIREVFLKNCER